MICHTKIKKKLIGNGTNLNSKDFFDKTTTFIKEHVGTLATLSNGTNCSRRNKKISEVNALAKNYYSPEN